MNSIIRKLDDKRLLRFLAIVTVSVLMIGGFNSTGRATTTGATTNDPMMTVKTTVDQVIKVVDDRELSQNSRRSKLIALVAGHFDFGHMARSALGYHWKQISPDQRQQFVPLFEAFIESAYLDKLDKYSGQTVKYLSKSSLGDGDVEIKTEVLQGDAKPIRIDYQLKQENQDWKVFDVTVENISITANYRNQFNRVINAQGFDALLSQVRDKQQELMASLGK
jgi:phospholipid transport system substrate-binding protein